MLCLLLALCIALPLLFGAVARWGGRACEEEFSERRWEQWK